MLNDAVGFSEIYVVCNRTGLMYGLASLARVLSFLDIENLASVSTFYLF